MDWYELFYILYWLTSFIFCTHNDPLVPFFTGWFLFAVFGGIGLAATPLDFWLVYVNRPKHMDAQAFAETQQSLRTRVNELVEIGELIKIEREERAQAGILTNRTALSFITMDRDQRSTAKEEREALLQFKQAVYLLEEDVEDFKNATSNWEKYNAAWPYLALFLGFCSFIISIFWFIHIVVYVFPSPPLVVRMQNHEWGPTLTHV